MLAEDVVMGPSTRPPDQRIAAVGGSVDWSEASQGDALFDLATLTLAHEEHPTTSSTATAQTSTAT